MWQHIWIHVDQTWSIERLHCKQQQSTARQRYAASSKALMEIHTSFIMTCNASASNNYTSTWRTSLLAQINSQGMLNCQLGSLLSSYIPEICNPELAVTSYRKLVEVSWKARAADVASLPFKRVTYSPQRIFNVKESWPIAEQWLNIYNAIELDQFDHIPYYQFASRQQFWKFICQSLSLSDPLLGLGDAPNAKHTLVQSSQGLP